MRSQSWDLTEATDPLPDGSLILLAGGVSDPPQVGLPTGLLNFLRIWWLAASRISNPRNQRRSHSIFYEQPQKSHIIIYSIFYWLQRSTHFSMWGYLYKSIYTRRWRSLGMILEAGYLTTLQGFKSIKRVNIHKSFRMVHGL